MFARRSSAQRTALARRLRSPSAQAWMFVFLVCVCVLGLTSWRLQRAYDLQVQTGQANAANLARSLAEHTNAAVHNAGTVVSGLVERIESGGLSDASSGGLQRLLVRSVADVPAISDVAVFSADGSGIVTASGITPTANVAERDYFLYHAAHRDGRVIVGTPVRSRADGRWSFTVSRRFNGPNGSFGGVVVALIDCSTLSKFYRTFDIGNGAIWLANEDGVLLARQSAAGNLIGQSLAQSPFMQAYREYGPVGSVPNALIDGVVRLSSFHKVEDFPLVVFVSLSRDDVLKTWRDDALVSFVVALAIVAILAIVGMRLAREFRIQGEKDREIRRRERQYRLLADYSTDIITHLGPDDRRLYVSPACERMLGHPPQSLLGGQLQDLTHPEDVPRLAANLAEIHATGQAPPVTHRVQRKDGIYLWVEMQGQRLADEQGVIVALRDISARRRVEELLHQANNHLQRQVMLDGLTGIANRRCFDLTLDKEFRRATRSQGALGTLMIDVDHFKTFNDRYGHQAGDTCLRSVADAISAQLRRPADFAARYGGEEFVVLLPDTDAAGAAAMAERIRAAVEKLGLAHAGSPFGCVTVSIGGAAAWPQSGESGEVGLVRAADAALYQAKSNGRNTVHCPGERILVAELHETIVPSR